MRKWNFGKSEKISAFFRLCLVIVIAFSLAAGGMSLSPRPAQAVLGIAPPVDSFLVGECQPFTYAGLSTTGFTCANQNVFFWLMDSGTGIPPWLTIDQNTGVISGCPPAGSAGLYTFDVTVTELCFCMPSCTLADCPPWGAGWFCADFTFPTSHISITVFPAGILPCVTAIDATYYPIAWEGMPFTMTLAATGGVGTLNWTATGLPVGLSVTDATNGIISGTPGPGTCGEYVVTVTVDDLGTCPDPTCPCVPISRDFLLIVDCWANYVPIFYYTTACNFNVQIGPGLTQGQTNVIIDGTHEATLVGGQQQNFTSVPCESHMVMVDQTVQVPGTNTRFSVIGSNTKMVSDVDNLAYFDYAQQVYIQTASEPAGGTPPPGTGYYAIGSVFSSTAQSNIESSTQSGVKYVFRDWRLPDGTTRPTSSLSFVVNQGGTATAEYDTYYQLTLKSEYPAINEVSWEKKDSTATWNLSLHAVPVEGGFWRFLGVTQTPVNASGQQTMNGPSTVEILWRPNYLPAIIAIVIVLLVIAGIIFLIRWLRGRPAANPGPAKTKIRPRGPNIKRLNKTG
jgi:hypothetical protein